MVLLRSVLVDAAGEMAADMPHMVGLRLLLRQAQTPQRVRSAANARLFNSEQRSPGRRAGAVLQCRPRRTDGPQGVAVGVRDRVACPGGGMAAGGAAAHRGAQRFPAIGATPPRQICQSRDPTGSSW